jgi:hypothetical protein
MTEATIVKTALEDWKLAKDGWAEIYRKAREDLRFQSDDEFAQWDDKVLQDRKNRPIYTVDQLTQFVHQVSNDIRMNTPTINIIPDDGADVETAEILQGIVRGIEYKSNADAAYDTAVDFAIKSSIGFIRVDHDYVKDDGFEQELLIKRVVNPQSCYIDPNSIQPDGSDAMFGFVLEEMSVKDFKAKYPKADPVSFTDVQLSQAPQDQDKITIVEYFKIVDQKVAKGLTDTGEVEDYVEEKKYKSKRQVVKRIVERYVLSGAEELEKTTFPGKYIPIVPVYGEEAWIEGKRNLLSLIRKAKSSQQLFNLGISLDVEVLMKQPQAAFMAVAGSISGFEDQYAQPEKVGVLYHTGKDLEGNAAPAPQRVNPPQQSAGFIGMSREAIDNIKSTLGMYNAAIGQRSNETSGVAINARKLEGDVGNYHFGDNLIRSITQVGKIIVCARREIYDTPRAVKMVDKEDNAKMTGINGHRVDGQEKSYYINDGEYDVKVKTGPAFTTQREEAAAFGMELAQAMPQLAPNFVDLVAQYRDDAASQAIAARLKKLVDPRLLDESERDKDAPNPQVEALTQQIQALQQEAQATIAELQAQLADKQADAQLKAGELEIKNKEVDIKAGELQVKAMQANQPIQDTGEAAVKMRELDIKEFEAKQKAEQENAKIALEAEKLKLETFKTMQSINSQEKDVESEDGMLEDDVEDMAEKQMQMQMLDGIMQTTQAVAQAMQGLTNAIQNPPPIQVIRDENGNIVGAQ